MMETISPMSEIRCFDPIVDDSSRILILGSMPGVESLRQQQYYGFGRNSFWRVIYAVFGETYTEDYEEQVRLLLRNGIALWDVISTCERRGSADAHIRNAAVNGFAPFYKAHPKITRVFFNGRKAYEVYRSQVGIKADGLSFTVLGSTSPAHAIAFEARLADWAKILE